MEDDKYYVPESSIWPVITSLSMGVLVIGLVGLFQDKSFGPFLFSLGLLGIIWIMFGWFGNVISESMSGLYNKQMDVTFRLGMFWFIVSEVFFFIGFFGALFYVRNFVVPWLGGSSNNFETNRLLWEGFVSHWPLITNPDNETFVGPIKDMGALWLPAINTLILILSSVTVTFAHHDLIKSKRSKLLFWLGFTIFLGISFLFLQVYEYYEAYQHMGLKLSSGIYGSTFFMLTGFHGMHVTIGTIMLIVMFARCYKGHFTPNNHFGFEATAWYWHFVDVVWLLVFIYVYVLPLR